MFSGLVKRSLRLSKQQRFYRSFPSLLCGGIKGQIKRLPYYGGMTRVYSPEFSVRETNEAKVTKD